MNDNEKGFHGESLIDIPQDIMRMAFPNSEITDSIQELNERYREILRNSFTLLESCDVSEKVGWQCFTKMLVEVFGISESEMVYIVGAGGAPVIFKRWINGEMAPSIKVRELVKKEAIDYIAVRSQNKDVSV